jgi:hypothetical protein
MEESGNIDSSAVASVAQGAGSVDAAGVAGSYKVTCYGPKDEFREEYAALKEQYDIAVENDIASLVAVLQAKMLPMVEFKWEDIIENLVTREGMAFILGAISNSGATLGAPYVGLYTAGTPTDADTMASHAGFTEAATTVVAARVSAGAWGSVTPGTTSTKATGTVVFTGASGGGTVLGCFLVTGSGAAATQGSTAGVLYSAGAFTGGSKTIALNDTLNVTYTASVTRA